MNRETRNTNTTRVTVWVTLAFFVLTLFGAHPAIALQDYNPADFDHGWVPYLGYHRFSGSAYLDGIEGGLRVIEYLTPEWAISVGAGAIYTELKTSNSSKKIVGTYGAELIYTLPVFSTIALFGLVGVGGTIDSAETTTALIGGGGIKIAVDDALSTRFEIRKGDDWTASGGLEFRLEGQNATEKRAPRMVRVEERQREHRPLKKGAPVQLAIHGPREIVRVSTQKKPFRDISGHWAEADIIAMTQLGVIESPVESPDQFGPLRPVSHSEAAKMILIATKQHEKSSHSAQFWVEIVGDPNTPYPLDVVVKNQQGQVVATLARHRAKTPGTLPVRWRNQKNGTLLPEGAYVIESHSDGQRARHPVVVKKASHPYRPVPRRDIALRDVPDTHPLSGFVHEAVALGVFPTILDGNYDHRLYFSPSENHSSSYRMKAGRLTALSFITASGNLVFQPDRSITRVEFLAAVGRALVYLGAETRAVAELSMYKDHHEIPDYTKEALDVYITELGYGGDDQKRLNPAEPITRAQAAVVLNRFANWKRKHLAQNQVTTRTQNEMNLLFLEKAKARLKYQEKVTAATQPESPKHASYRVYVGDYSQKEPAENQCKRLEKQNIPCYVIEEYINRSLVYHVQVGAFKEEVLALDYMAVLKESGYTPSLQVR